MTSTTAPENRRGTLANSCLGRNSGPFLFYRMLYFSGTRPHTLPARLEGSQKPEMRSFSHTRQAPGLCDDDTGNGLPHRELSALKGKE